MGKEILKKGDSFIFTDPVQRGSWRLGVIKSTQPAFTEGTVYESYADFGKSVKKEQEKLIVKPGDIRLKRLPSPELLGQ